VPGSRVSRCRAAAVCPGPDRYLDRSRSGWEQPQQGRAAPVAEQGTVSAREDGRHVAAVARHERMSDRVDAGVHAVQAAGSRSSPDRVAAQAHRQQLSAAYDAMLSGREPRDLRVEMLGLCVDALSLGMPRLAR
jgi:hypothetical protein